MARKSETRSVSPETKTSAPDEADACDLLPITISVDPEARESNLVPALASLLLARAKSTLGRCA
jgi:hypothetical protein